METAVAARVIRTAGRVRSLLAPPAFQSSSSASYWQKLIGALAGKVETWFLLQHPKEYRRVVLEITKVQLIFKSVMGGGTIYQLKYR